MLPSLLARDIEAGVKQFLVTAFEPSDSFSHGLVQRLIDDAPRWMKGPFLQLGLPFREGTAGTGAFGNFTLRFPSWVHQEQAWTRLRTDRGAANILACLSLAGGFRPRRLDPVPRVECPDGALGIAGVVLAPGEDVLDARAELEARPEVLEPRYDRGQRDML